MKTIHVVDADGNERILANADGISLLGEAKGAIQLKAGAKPQIVYTRNGTTFLTLGELKDAANGKGTIDGLATNYDGASRITMTSRDSGSFFNLDTEEGAKDIEQLYDNKEHDTT